MENVKGKKVIITLALISLLACIYSFVCECILDWSYIVTDIPGFVKFYIWPIAVEGLFAVYIFMRIKNKKCDHLFLATLGIIVLGVIICSLKNIINADLMYYGFFDDGNYCYF